MDSVDSVFISLKVLIECLKKKKEALKRIVDITENQGCLLNSELAHEEVYSFFMQMNGEKQEFIQKVLQCDNVFENMFQKVGSILDDNPSKYGEQVRILQNMIREVMDLDAQIRVSEDNNSQILTQTMGKIKALPLDKSNVIGTRGYGSHKIIEAYKNQAQRRSD